MDSSELRDELQKLKDSGQTASESHNNRYRPRNKERFKNGTYHNSTFRADHYGHADAVAQAIEWQAKCCPSQRPVMI